ncbi:hypothetical protein [Undibacterium sp.]|nr:hypothetical protein [Undibacterium sp.]
MNTILLRGEHGTKQYRESGKKKVYNWQSNIFDISDDTEKDLH